MLITDLLLCWLRLKPDLETPKDILVISTGFQHVIDSYFWYMPFANVRQCKIVLEKAKIPDDTWMKKRAAITEEHKLPGARDELRAGLKEWIKSDFYLQRRSDDVIIPDDVDMVVMED